MSRTHWVARLFGIRPPAGEARQPGLIMIQLDGLSRSQLERALLKGKLPFLSRLIYRQHFTLETFYSGVPSTTPAVQAELFFGVKAAVPAFHFIRRRDGREFRMYEASSAALIEEDLLGRCPEPLLQGGHSYSNIYRAGATRSRYCSQDFAPDEIFKRLHPLKWLVLSVAYLPKILRVIFFGVVEIVVAVVDAVRGLFAREDLFKEISFVPARVGVCALLREAVRLRVLLDIERGVQVVHANFLGYDEQAHRRGPDSAFAHWTLRGIDRAIRDIYHDASTSRYRDYELMIYSDHGQERTVSYLQRQGRELKDALSEVFSTGILSGREVWIRKMPKLLGSTVDRWRSFLGIQGSSQISEAAPDVSSQIVVTAMGPLGHVYLPVQLELEDLDRYAARLVSQAGIPLVLLRGNGDFIRAHNSRGIWLLPRDGAEVLGAGHPFLGEAADDLVRLCGHPDAGDLIISGWDPQRLPLSFAAENGGHGGPGAEETAGFLLVPDRIRRWHFAHLAGTRQRVRGCDLREIVGHYLGRDGERHERVTGARSSNVAVSIRVMTYNIHSCAGMDGKVRPERVARVINHFDPDVVAVQEVDCHRPRTGGQDQAQLIADHLRMSHVFEAMFEEEKERYGIAIFSKHPLSLIKAGYLTKAGSGIFAEARGAIWVQVELEGRKLFHFINTHFGLGRGERARQVKKLLGPRWVGGIPENEPVIVCGDFNAGPSSPVVKSLQVRLRDCQGALEGAKPKATFSSINPFLRLDHVFVSNHFQVKRVEVPRTPTAVVASDHLPVCVELGIHA
jgi:endonuclease/exonuclease/phosphatase family metal-dependent hydrolase